NAGESSKRSDIIDITYGNLHEILTQQDGVHLDQYLKPQKKPLRRVTQVFGKLSDASRKKIESGSVLLPDGELIQIDDGQKECLSTTNSRSTKCKPASSFAPSFTAMDSLERLVVRWRPLLLDLPRTLRRCMARNGFTPSGSSFLCST
ncbi:hypothetical protein K443DRAFT_632415, partial [Laccaria amethystina LaAM-08-1]